MILNLKLARIKKGLTQEALAAKVGITRTIYSNIERGKTEPTRDIMKKLSEALDTPIMDLFFSE